MGSAAQYEAGNPAAAWIEDIRREGTKLVATVVNWVPKVTQWIKAKLYRDRSSEIDKTPMDQEHPDFGVMGPVLKAVSLLGANAPAVKTLALMSEPVEGKTENVEIFDAGLHKKGTPDQVYFSIEELDRIVENFPKVRDKFGYTPYVKIGEKDPHGPDTLKFSESARRNHTVICHFAEVNTMDRQQMLDACRAAGMNPDVIVAAVPDDQLDAVLAEILKGVKPPEQPPADAAMSQQAQTPGQPKKVQWSFSEADMKAAIAPYVSELESVKTDIKTTKELTAERLKAEHRQDAHKFSEDCVARGYLCPADVECDQAGEPLPHTKLAELLRAPTVKTHTFSEGGKTVSKSEYELQKEAILKRTPHTFSEKIAGGSSKQNDIYKTMRERGAAVRVGRGVVRTIEQRLNMLPTRGMR